MRRELLANVSHDLRTPISSILSAATSALEDDGLAPATRRYLRAGVNQAWRLNRLVQDMLDMVRLEAGALQIEPEAMDLREVVDAAIGRLELDPGARRVTTKIDAEIVVRADWHRLGQVLDNLLSNAIRFAPHSTPISVSGARDPAGNLALVRVTDQGAGVPEELRDRIFDRFVRSSDSRGGTGLGLCIVRGLVEAHGGRVWLETGPDAQTTTFAFTIPLSEADAA
jgi:two-component system sensor histidine kinase KdpD